jgi:glycosyltransferase involved in cell wall biosynthesis
MRKMIEQGESLLVYSPLGVHMGTPKQDLLYNILPRRKVEGKTTFLSPPVLYTQKGKVSTPLVLFFSTFFILLYLTATRTKISAQYCTTILAGVVSAAVWSVKKIPLVANYGDPDYAREAGLSLKLFLLLEQVVSRNCKYMVCGDEVMEKYVQSKYRLDTVFLPGGGYEPRGVSDASSASTERVVLYSGQVTSLYRTDLLLESIPKVLAKVPDAKFMIVGDGSSLPAFRRRIVSLGLTGSVTMTGSVPYARLGSVVDSSRVCLQLTNDICMGTKVILYMVHKRAVISAGGWYDKYGIFLRSNENSILIPPDADILADKIIDLLQNSELTNRLGAEAWRTVEPYSWARHASETIALLRSANSNENRTSIS